MSDREVYQALFEASPDGIVIFDDHGRCLEANEALSAFLRISRSELAGRLLLELVPAELLERGEQVFSRPDSAPGTHVDLPLLAADGTLVELEWTLRRNFRPGLHLGIARDGSERRGMEMDQLRLAAIVESSEDAIIGKNLDGIITSWNKGAENLYGYTAEEMVGQPVSRLAVEGKADELPRILARIARGERIEHYQTERRAKDGRILTVSLSVSPIRDKRSGAIVGASKIARDITDRKRAEEALMAQAQAMARSNADLQQFAYVTSHDLQEPLRNIISYSQLLVKRYQGKLDRDADDFLNYIVQGAGRMQTLIADLLAYSRAVSAQPAVQASADLNAALDWALNNLRKTIQDSGATVTREPLPAVSGDLIQLVQLFEHLLANAIKFRAQDPPRVHVSATRKDDEWVVTVEDNGIGIEEQYYTRVFGIFKRLHGPEVPGTGIGLAICRKILENHGGRIWVESRPGQGSRFHFSLPARPEDGS
ncbi:MAG: PAS domain S-box protein [Bryobacterales bacterium]|nr:PAS domain S-box protein [Bryobacterales bacterium]